MAHAFPNKTTYNVVMNHGSNNIIVSGIRMDRHDSDIVKAGGLPYFIDSVEVVQKTSSRKAMHIVYHVDEAFAHWSPELRVTHTTIENQMRKNNGSLAPYIVKRANNSLHWVESNALRQRIRRVDEEPVRILSDIADNANSGWRYSYTKEFVNSMRFIADKMGVFDLTHCIDHSCPTLGTLKMELMVRGYQFPNL